MVDFGVPSGLIEVFKASACVVDSRSIEKVRFRPMASSVFSNGCMSRVAAAATSADWIATTRNPELIS